MHNTDTTPTKVQKKAKLGVIPDGWTTPKINEVFQFINTTSFSRNQLNYDADNELYYIHYGDIHATYKKPLLDFEIETNIPRLNKGVELPNSVQYLQDGDVIIADASEDYEGVGEAIEIKNLNGKAAISGLHTFALRDLNNKTVPGFRTYIFKNPNVKKALKTIATGSKVYGVSKGNIQKFKIMLPPRPEQQKIAQILAVWDLAINKQRALLGEKQELKNGLITNLIVAQKDKYKIVRLKEVCSKIQDGNYGAKYPKADEFLEEGVPFLTSKAIGSGGKIYYKKLSFISKTKHEELTKGHLKLNDVLFTNRGANVGAVAMVSQDISNGNIGPQLTLLRTNDIILPEFLKYTMNSNILRKQILQQDSGSAMNFFGIRDTSKFKIPLPSILEQNKVIAVLKSIDKELEIMNNSLALVKSQKQGLIQQLLTGKIRVKI
tara:strand:- start:1783 stop:3087 length:1305 start_codon:yes stop_codon:yes gene_type:complete